MPTTISMGRDQRITVQEQPSAIVARVEEITGTTERFIEATNLDGSRLLLAYRHIIWFQEYSR